MTCRDHGGGALSGLRGKKVYIETYGCRYNFGDTANLWEILRSQGCTRAGFAEDADAVIINTCTVVAQTERRMLRRLAQVRDHALYVTGCMPEVQREAILAVCTPAFISHDDIRRRYRDVSTVPAEPVAIVQIAQGCLGTCTYCLSRKARGTLQSTPLPVIVRSVAAHAQNGAVEIQLTAQDTGAWGRDIGMALPDLLRAAAEIDGCFRLRLGMMNPETVLPILDDLLEAFESARLFRFIHVPVQSGSDRVLQRMGRGYRVADFEQIIAAFRDRFPGITVMTDIIAGFPGETDEDFECSLGLVKRLQCGKVNVTRYSRRPMTPAYSFPDFPDAVKKERSRLLIRLAEEGYRALHGKYHSRTVSVLVTERIRHGSVMGRTGSYLGVVLDEDLPPGSVCRAEIRETGTYYLRGSRVS